MKNDGDSNGCRNSCNASELMGREEKIREKFDETGIKWKKVYFGGGAHYQNWLKQCIEIYGEDNIEIEEVAQTGLSCFDGEDEKAYRIWAKDKYYDVIIIGAGPAGLKCAEQLKDTNLSVLLLEKNSSIGHKICAGGLTGLVSSADIPEDRARSFKKQTIIFKEKEYSIELVHALKAVDRLDLGRHLLGKIENSKNITILKDTIVQSIEKNEIKTDKGAFFYRYLVGADGSSSIVRRFLGLKTRVCFGLYCDVPEVLSSLIWYFNIEKLRGGYIWVFPHIDYSCIGILYNPEYTDHRRAKEILREYLKENGFDYSDNSFSAAPVNYYYRGCEFNNIFLIGDAAGLASKLTGEGVSFALISGSEAGKKILNPKYRMSKLKKGLSIKRRQEAMVKIFDIFGRTHGIQKLFYKIIIKGLKFGRFQSFFGNQKLDY